VLPVRTPITDSQVLQQALPRYGTLVYLHDRAVWEGVGLGDDRRLVDLPFDEIEAAELADERLWLLADGQLAAVDLASGQVRTTDVVTGAIVADLLVMPERQLVAYAVSLGDARPAPVPSTLVGVCDFQMEQARSLAEIQGWIGLLGAAPGGDVLYATRTGSDGGGPIVTIDLVDG